MQSFPRKIRVDVSTQRLELLEGRLPAQSEGEGGFEVIASFPVSTSGYGLGSEPGSFKTPLGRFEIGEMIGAGAPPGAVFKSREPTGMIAPFESPGDPEDLVQTRILWLRGLEPHNANTHERYIYIHGTNHEESIGVPCSHGCIRMKNEDVIDLFGMVEPGTEMVIA